ncbi:MAG: hypothetical protein WEA24_06925 [Gemmatimonadota bacterium]
MQQRNSAGVVLIAALAFAACVDGPLEPGTDTGEVAAAGSLEATSAAVTFAGSLSAAAVSDRSYLPTLDHASSVALRAVAEAEGQAAASAIQGRYRDLLAQAEDAAAAGRYELARQLQQAARQLRLETVIHAFGGRVALRLHAVVGERLRALEERTAAAAEAGQDVARVQALLRAATRLHREAAEALREGHAVGALDADFHAVDRLNEAATALG